MAEGELPNQPDPVTAYADLDLGRAARRGYPEAIYCEGKSVEQVSGIATTVRAHPEIVTLFTRASPDHAEAILAELPDAAYDVTARLLAWPPQRPEPTGGRVVVVAAGTSDQPVAREAQLTAQYLGRETELIVDAGVAGLHRILSRLDTLRSARVLVVAAGMDGALPSVVAGLVSAPVIALPTSVGYGAAFGGIAALLTMLNSCSPGVSVVNIDNGYGAGHLAAQIAAPPPAADPPPTYPHLSEVPPTYRWGSLGHVGGRRVGFVSRHAWIDASAGVAGDMLLGALLDAGAELAVVQRAVDAVVPGSVAITTATVHRAGMRATKAEVGPLVDEPPHRTWSSIRTMIETADLAEAVRGRALAVFARLAEAEGRVHGHSVEDVHFHEVGALDSIADVVGVCAALVDLGVEAVTVSAVAVGSGEINAAHGRIPVPVPAVAELARGWVIRAGGTGELTTPTGMALVSTLAERSEDLPPLVVDQLGVGAGTKDFAGRANVTRVIIGTRSGAQGSGTTGPDGSSVLLEANVDDLDPRLWPEVLARLMREGADDAWLTPILMKKGRPAHTLSVLCDPSRADALRTTVLTTTSTIGVRQSPRTKHALPRLWVQVEVDGAQVPVKVAHLDGVITQVSAEFEDVAELARQRGRTQQEVLNATMAAASAAGWWIGGSVPGAQ